MNNFNLKKIREQKGFTIEKLAGLANISAGYLCRLENGSRNNPSILVMKNIAKALGVDIAEIFFE